MDSIGVVLAVIDALARIDCAYMLVGSFATNLHGIPRSTQDADFVIEASASPQALAAALGPGFVLDPQVSFEGVTGTTRYDALHSGSRFRVELFLLSDDPHDRERFARRQPTTLDGRPVFIASPEDTIVTKVRWAQRARRRKDEDDVLNVLRVRAGQLDLAYIRSWCDRHGTRGLFEQLLKESDA